MELAWVLPSMKSAMTLAQPIAPRIAFFQTEILGAARACDKLAVTAKKNKTFYHTKVVDLWSLLPCFFTKPSDISTGVPSMVPTLAKAIEDKRYPELVVRFFAYLVATHPQT
jgi:hypothetical protein